MNPRRLYRSRNDKQLAGVAAGMAEYLELDPTLIRILWILSAFLGGFTILLYIILAFIIPLAPAAGGYGPSWAPGGSWAPAGSWGPGASPAPGAAWGPGASPAPGAASGPAHRRRKALRGFRATPAPRRRGAASVARPATLATASAARPARPGDHASPTQGWDAAQAGWSTPAWTGGQVWTAPAPEAANDRRRGPGAAVYVGVILVVFGVIALADAVVPGLAGISLVPALLVALGAALLIGSMRRSNGEA